MKKSLFLLCSVLCLLFINLTASSPRLLIKIPTRSRPTKFFEKLKNYYEKLSHKIPYHFLISCDTDDASMNNEQIKDILKKLPNLTVRFTDNKSKIDAYNASLDEFMKNFDMVLLASDDMEPVLQDYDVLITQYMQKFFPDYDGVLHFRDFNVDHIISTYPIIGKTFFKRFGYAYFPGYKSFYCDEELTTVCQKLNKIQTCDEVILRHFHPMYDVNSKWDPLYARSQKNWNTDQALFNERKKHNFYLNEKSREAKKPKIVGLMQVRNEANILEQSLRALACYTDAIVIVDDASTDETMAIIKRLALELNIEKIICNEFSNWERKNESDNQQMLLEAGREVGGTHFVFIDADELFTANCMENNFLKRAILSLNPGDLLFVCWIQLWRSIKQYRFDSSVWTNNYKEVIFCDDGECSYSESFLNGIRCPNNLKGKKKVIRGYQYGLLHFQFVNWRNLLVKQSWYRCLEHIRFPENPVNEINKLYGKTKDETNLGLKPSPEGWFQGYRFFNQTVYEKPVTWREKQVTNWLQEYGKDFFTELDIWDVDWSIEEEIM